MKEVLSNSSRMKLYKILGQHLHQWLTTEKYEAGQILEPFRNAKLITIEEYRRLKLQLCLEVRPFPTIRHKKNRLTYQGPAKYAHRAFPE